MLANLPVYFHPLFKNSSANKIFIHKHSLFETWRKKKQDINKINLMCQDFPCQNLSLCELRFICTKFMPWSKTFITFAWQKIMPFKTLQQFQQIFLCLKKKTPSKPVYTCSVNNQLMQKLKLPPSHWLLRIKYKSWQAKIKWRFSKMTEQTLF